MGLTEFVQAIKPETELYPYQKMLLKMLEKLPEGAEIKTDVSRRMLPRTYAIRDGVEFVFNGEEWVAT